MAVKEWEAKNRLRKPHEWQTYEDYYSEFCRGSVKFRQEDFWENMYCLTQANYVKEQGLRFMGDWKTLPWSSKAFSDLRWLLALHVRMSIYEQLMNVLKTKQNKTDKTNKQKKTHTSFCSFFSWCLQPEITWPICSIVNWVYPKSTFSVHLPVYLSFLHFCTTPKPRHHSMLDTANFLWNCLLVRFIDPNIAGYCDIP